MIDILFNIHDLTLVMTVFLSLLLAFIYQISPASNKRGKLLLVAFLIAHAFISVHELTYYGNQFRYLILELSPNLFFIGSFAYCVDAVLLCFFTQAVIYRDFSFKRHHWVHLAPLVLFLIYMVSAYYSLDYWPKRVAIWEWRLTDSWHYVTVEFAIRAIRIAYALYCIRLVARYTEQQKMLRADLAPVDLTWLKGIVIGFVGVMLAECGLSALKMVDLFYPVETIFFIHWGVSIYYVTFLLLLVLFAYTVVKLPLVEQLPQEQESEPEKEEIGAEGVVRVKEWMEQQKSYLNPDITLAELAQELEMPPKILSLILNHHFNLNFYEFINGYRVQEAKRVLLASPEKKVTEVLYEVGFNSKSVFYTFFRKAEGMTPAAYRKKNAQSVAE